MTETTGATRPTRPALRYHGGKWMLSSWIISHFPKHHVYVEPFCGAASVLLRKPRAYAEVINDMDGEVCNLFRVLRDPASAKDLQNAVFLTPFAREEFLLSYEAAADPIERARRLMVRSFMGFGSAGHNPKHRTGFRANSNRSGTTPAHDWMHYPDNIRLLGERLRGVVVENRAAADLIPHHDSRETLFYVDPPYPLSTRYNNGNANCYTHEMTDMEHRSLAAVLHSVSGMVVLSGYACDLYDLELFPNWQRIEKAAFADGAAKRTEVLWMNEAAASRAAQGSLDMTFATARNEADAPAAASVGVTA